MGSQPGICVGPWGDVRAPGVASGVLESSQAADEVREPAGGWEVHPLGGGAATGLDRA